MCGEAADGQDHDLVAGSTSAAAVVGSQEKERLIGLRDD